MHFNFAEYVDLKVVDFFFIRNRTKYAHTNIKHSLTHSKLSGRSVFLQSKQTKIRKNEDKLKFHVFRKEIDDIYSFKINEIT